MPVRAVIFDMDGVLLDSMRYHVKAWQKVFKTLGLYIPAYEIYSREGEDWRKTTRDFLRMAGYKPSLSLVEGLFKERDRIFRQIFKPRVFKGAKALLTSLQKSGIRLGLVTATPRRDVKRMLPVSMVCLFEVMVCGGDVKKGKPHPAPYLEVLKKLKLKPAETLVIENAPYGIKSARLAGIRCIAVATSLPREYLKGADRVVGSLRALRSYFSRQGLRV